MANSRTRAGSLTLAALTIFAVTPALALEGTSWRTASGSGIVRLERCNGDRLCGVIARVLGPDAANARDANNPDTALKSRPLQGVMILSGFARRGDRWTGGRIYNPEDGRSYRSELRALANGTLEVKGCLGPICRNQIWSAAR
jgi:uncharacterized protein (DUF2147 family)